MYKWKPKTNGEIYLNENIRLMEKIYANENIRQMEKYMQMKTWD